MIMASTKDKDLIQQVYFTIYNIKFVQSFTSAMNPSSFLLKNIIFFKLKVSTAISFTYTVLCIILISIQIKN